MFTTVRVLGKSPRYASEPWTETATGDPTVLNESRKTGVAGLAS